MTAQPIDFLDITRRAVANVKGRTTDLAEGTMALPVSAYFDPERYRREVDRIFRRVPLGVALSTEMPAPGNYLARTVLDVPVLLVRAEDGVARAFINVCRHRGAPVCEPGAGTAQRFVCPYHAWTYNLAGVLDGVYGATTFGEIDQATMSLTELPAAERAGVVWMSLTPGTPFDIDDWLGEFVHQIEALDLQNWHVFERREFDGPGWKVAWDGYLEGYHQGPLHPETVGKNTISNMMVWDTYGAHQRIVFARKTLMDMIRKPESDWDTTAHIRFIHSTFPNLSMSGVLGDHCLVSQLYPGPRPDQSRTVQTLLCRRKPETAAEEQSNAAFSAMVLLAVQDEDYAVGYKIQRGLTSGGNTEFVFGRNEPTLQHYHRCVQKFAEA